MNTALTEPRESRIVRSLEESANGGQMPTNDRQVRVLEDDLPNRQVPTTESQVRSLEECTIRSLPTNDRQVRVLDDSTNCGKLPMSGSKLLPPGLSHRLGSCGSWKREPVVPCPPTSAKSAHARQPNALVRGVVA